MAKLKKSEFRFERNDIIGSEGAEEDQEFLYECFINTGELVTIKDTNNQRRIVVGRTGCGKTALLLYLEHEEENTTWLEPEHLALNFISNSTILPYLEEKGIRLDTFYKLLWRHVLIVELIKLKYNVKDANDQKNFIARMTEIFRRDRHKEEAFKYLIEWGETFWEDTEYRVHEVTNKLHERIEASLGFNWEALKSKLRGESTTSEEERKQIIHRVQDVVNQVQIQKLSKVIEILANDVFNEKYPHFFIIIDKLDEHWVDEPLKLRLIRALIETQKDLMKLNAVKILIAIRQDLLERVFRLTRDEGFQEEKYQPLILRISWTKSQLFELLEKRINKLVGRRYTKQKVSYKDLFPPRIGDVDLESYMIERTFFRPRDVIQFGNYCIESAMDKSQILARDVRNAETYYSKQRFRSIGDEWYADYPLLLPAANSILRGRRKQFLVSEINDQDVENFCLLSVDKINDRITGRLGYWIRLFWENKIGIDDIRLKIVKMFYDVGIVGLRLSSGDQLSWSFKERSFLTFVDVDHETRLTICPMFYRVLGIVFKD